MKKVLSNLLYMVAVAALVSACKKDLPVVTLDTSNPTAPKLTATESKIT